MQTKMPKRKLISHAIKYATVYLITCVVITLIGLGTIANVMAEQESTMRIDSFRWAEDENQKLFSDKVVSFQNKETLPEIFYRSTWASTAMALVTDDRKEEVMAYGYLKDSETDETLLDSTDYVFLALRFHSKEKAREVRGFDLDRDRVLFYCHVSVFEESYVRFMKEQGSTLTGTLGEAIRHKATWEDLLEPGNGFHFTAMDVWKTGVGTFLPGKILVTWKDNRNTESVVLDFTPAQIDGYVHVEDLDRVKVPQTEEEIGGAYYFFTDIAEISIPDEEFKEEARNRIRRLGSNTTGTSVETERILGIPTEIRIAIQGSLIDQYGKIYVLCQYVVIENFAKDMMHMFGEAFNVIYEITFAIFAIICFLSYNRKKYKYESENYRKMLVNVMAHDLKTPLTAMEGYAESLKEGVNTDKREVYAEEIERNVKYVNEIISENLATSQYEFEKKRIKRKPVELTELCAESIRRYQSKADEKKLRFVTEGKTRVRGDAELLQRVFDNLIVNAVKYSVPESEIKILGENHKIRIQNVTDQKPEGKLKRLWQPFVRGSESRSGEKGTGLGLYVAAKILNDHKWKYKLKFDEKSGTFECEIKVPLGILF